MAREGIDSSGEVNMEKFEEQMNAFMHETFVIWYGEKDARKAEISMQAIPLSEMNYEGLRKTDASLFGQYTINPETAGMNHKEKEPKVKILNEELKQFIGKPRSKVVAHIVKTYGGQYHIPGLEYEKYLLENPDKEPKELKDGNWYYFMGSTLRGVDGHAYVSYMYWRSDKRGRGSGRLDSKWNSDGRVLLLEK